MLAQLPRFAKGDDPRKAVNAEFLNQLVDASRRAGKLDTTGRNPGVGGTAPTTLVKAQNLTGDLLPFGAVVVAAGLAKPFDTAADRLQFRLAPYFEADAPGAATDQPMIVARPIEDQDLGLVAVAGIAVTRIDVTDALHLYAVPIVGETGHLASAESGPVRILHKSAPDDGTIGWAVVLLGGGGGSGGGSFDDLTCVRVVTWSACNETGGQVLTFKWLTLPTAWVSDTPGVGCPPAETEE